MKNKPKNYLYEWRGMGSGKCTQGALPVTLIYLRKGF